jgi:DNA adenine methylase
VDASIHQGRIEAQHRDKPNRTVSPVIGPLPYIGGKRAIAKRIIEIFPEHTTYVEAFCGGAQVLFHKEPSKSEVINDLDHEVVNVFRVCQQHYEELLRFMRWMLTSRTWFDLLENTNPETLTDIQRAARYLYLLKNDYAGLVRHHVYTVSITQPPGFNPERLPESIAEAHTRLARVQIESLPYEKILAKYDRPTTLFYLDPPYYARKLYRYNLSHDDFVAMAERLKALKGKFVLSLNDLPQVRAIFAKFRIREIEMAYTSQKKAGRRFSEVLITNF